MPKLLRLFMPLLGIYLFLSPARAAEPVHMMMYQLEYRLGLDGDKPYNKIAAELFAGLEDQLDLDITPMSRAVGVWGVNQRSCAFPANPWSQAQFSGHAELVSSIPLDIVSVRVYLPTDAPDVTSLSDLAGKSTAYIRGSIAGKIIEPYGVTPTEVKSEEQLIGLLKRGRIEAFLGFHPDTAIALEQLGGGDLMKATSLSVEGMRLPVGVVCFRFPGSDELIDKINRNAIRLHESGRLRKLLSNHAELPGPHELDHWMERISDKMVVN